MGEALSLRGEADRIERTARARGLTAARQELRALLDRPRQLEGRERTLVLDFNARLCTMLRERGVRLWGDC